MLEEPRCHKLRCKYYLGVLQPDGTEEREYQACEVFDEIPASIAYGSRDCQWFDKQQADMTHNGLRYVRCGRCGRETYVLTMSYFNTDMLCCDCEEKERQHPKFDGAVEREEEALRRGDFFYAGIGKPADL